MLSNRDTPVTGEKYRHFKRGKIVEILAVSQDAENPGTYSVVYRCDGRTWHRPLDMFLSKTDKAKYPDATQEFRFEKVGE